MRSKTLLVANILATAYAVYLFCYFGNSMLDSNGAAAIGGAIATMLVAPHMFSFLIGAVFGWVGYAQRKNWGALTAAILYTVGTVTFLTYFMFGAPILIMGFVGYACQKKCNEEYELEQREQAETAQYTGELNFDEVKKEYNAVKRKTNSTVWIVFAVAIVVIFWGAYGALTKEDDTAKTTASTSNTTNTTTNTATTTTTNKTTTTTTTETKKEPETILYDAELTDGNYTVGIDLPAGRYTITAIDGSGNVSSSNMYDGGLNETMAAVASDMYITEFKNATFKDGDILEVKNGVTIKIHSDKASATPLKKRVQPNTETVTLTSGYYISGEDFPAGVYDIIATEGSGNVSSDNLWDGGINATMSVEKTNFYETNYKNIDLPSGTEIKISGITVDLVPSK